MSATLKAAPDHDGAQRKLLLDLRAFLKDETMAVATRLTLNLAIEELLAHLDDAPALDAEESGREYLAFRKARLDLIKTVVAGVQTFTQLELEKVKAQKALVAEQGKVARQIIEDLRRHRLDGDIHLNDGLDTVDSMVARLQGARQEMLAR